jgi:hypothetical protein
MHANTGPVRTSTSRGRTAFWKGTSKSTVILLKEKQNKASLDLLQYIAFLSKVTKMNYLSKAKSSNVRDFPLLIGTVDSSDLTLI